MELHTVELALRGGNGSHRACVGAADNREAGWRLRHHVAMAHPDLLPTGQAGEQRVVSFVEFERGQAILAFFAARDRSSQQVRHQLLPVADAQHSLAGGENRRIASGAFGIVYAGRAARDDDPLGPGQIAGPSLARPHFRVHAQVAHLASLQVTILPAGVQYDDLWSGIQISIVARARAAGRVTLAVLPPVFSERAWSSAHEKDTGGKTAGASGQSVCGRRWSRG